MRYLWYPYGHGTEVFAQTVLANLVLPFGPLKLKYLWTEIFSIKSYINQFFKWILKFETNIYAFVV